MHLPMVLLHTAREAQKGLVREHFITLSYILLQCKNQKGAITFAARRHNINLLLSNSTFLIFAVLVV